MSHGSDASVSIQAESADLSPGGCAHCNSAVPAAPRIGAEPRQASTAQTARRGLRRLQIIMGALLLSSSATGIFLLATDKSLWLLAVSHAIGLIIIIGMDFVLGLYNLASSRSAYVPTIAAAFLGFVLQLGDITTAPQYNMTIPYFAHYLFGLGAFDTLLGLQLAIIFLGLAGRPHARYLARRKTKRGRELSYSRRGFVKALVGFAGLVGVGFLIGSIKLPAAGTTVQTPTGNQTGTVQGSVANSNNLKVGVPVYFEYPKGYPNALIKTANGTLDAISLLCTHVCCQCSYDSAASVFYCPCHGSVFDTTGKVVRGPAAIPLPKVTLRVDSSGEVFPIGVSNPGPCQV